MNIEQYMTVEWIITMACTVLLLFMYIVKSINQKNVNRLICEKSNKNEIK